MTRTTPTVLVIAGLDPSGGAGLVADIQTLSALGVHPAVAATTLTVQDTRNAYEVRPLDAEFVVAQARAVLADMPVAAVKLGLLGSAATGEAVAALLNETPDIPVVLDPVLVASGGAKLAEDALVDTMRNRLLPRATLATPNRREFLRLAGQGNDDAERAAELLARGCPNLLVTGGDDDTDTVRNTLYSAAAAQQYEWPRLDGPFHGSGCTLAAAAAASLAHGMSVPDAVKTAQDFTFNALNTAQRIGRGQPIPNRMP
ncbi:MAG TPA: bifunctional hydroxymethylpyrimidine kinase/phosphomethylpyrimidine kinase [Gammaproteobacteria bacterium]|nr:bifunctional hydroxymethylpyrimidine kinase/phosphomethylpyrimidine kinase [Gammaproteobacteria bacterium]